MEEWIALNSEFSEIDQYFQQMGKISKPLMERAQKRLEEIKPMLCSLPSFVETVKAIVPETTFQAILTGEQQAKLASGALKLMSKKNGSLMATLVNPVNNKMVANIPLEQVNLTPELTSATTNFAMQMQLAELSEQIKSVQIAVEEIRKGQENDRLAIAYSCMQKYLQATAIKNQSLKELALLNVISDAEDSRNSLMLSQKANIEFVKNQPKSFSEKVFSRNLDDYGKRVEEIYVSFFATSMVSQVEALAYQEIGEPESMRISLDYYSEHIDDVFLKDEKIVGILDMNDSIHPNFWSQQLCEIKQSVTELTCNRALKLGEAVCCGTEKM